MFYKKTEDEILKGENISTPLVTLKVEDKDSYTYPQDGWYWFNSFDEALVFFASQTRDSITMRQARLYLLSIGLLNQVETVIARNEEWKIEWEYATEVQKDSPLVLALAKELNLTPESIDLMFNEAGVL